MSHHFTPSWCSTVHMSIGWQTRLSLVNGQVYQIRLLLPYCTTIYVWQSPSETSPTVSCSSISSAKLVTRFGHLQLDNNLLADEPMNDYEVIQLLSGFCCSVNSEVEGRRRSMLGFNNCFTLWCNLGYADVLVWTVWTDHRAWYTSAVH